MILRYILDAMFPPLCLCCERRLIGGERYICGPCVGLLPRPSDRDIRENGLAQMFWITFPIEGATAAFRYYPGDVLSRTLHEMKYGHNRGLCRFMGRVMAAEANVAKLLASADILVPVPLSRKRERERGYNQCTELCQGISEATGIPMIATSLLRNDFTRSQTTMGNRERSLNIKEAFFLADTSALPDRHVVIVDDIITTGATIKECIVALRHIPGVKISVLAMAQTT